MKTAWIFPGGSARAVYTAGTLYGLCETDLKKPDIIIGCSGSAPTSLCYVSGQKEVIKNVWCRSLSNRNFLSFLRIWKVLNVDYLIDDVLKKHNPLDMENIKNSPVLVYLPVTDSETGEVVYFSNKMNVDLYEVSRAAVSVPFWTNLFSLKGVLINNKYYSDWSPSARFQMHVRKAMSEGATRIIVFDNYHENDNPTGYFFSKLFIFFRNQKFRSKQFSYFKEIEGFTVPSGVEFVLFKPKYALKMSRWNNDNANANSVFERGYHDVLQDKGLI